MSNFTTTDPDFAIGGSRIFVSLVALLSIFIDPSNGGFLGIEPSALGILLVHLLYSVLMYIALQRTSDHHDLATISVPLDVFFAAAVAFITEGRPTSPAFVFFVFAIVAAGFRFNPRTCLGVTVFSVVLYLMAISFATHFVSNSYMMRAAYLAIAGYIVGFFADQRAKFEARVHELESAAERQAIARDLHDGYVQALAGIHLRLGACERWLDQNQPSKARTEVKGIQVEVTREYDEVRKYVHSLANTQYNAADLGGRTTDQTEFRVKANFATNATLVEHALQIVLEGMRNARQHGKPRIVAVSVQGLDDTIRITIDDDGVGFAEPSCPPWSIASRVAEVRGELRMIARADAGAHLQIDLPAA
ncbi:sensor histidine kinase [Candidatus Binatus sp.]|uniref:sensor histidine kinase n=1 Tax=Candidatus Binatus sp. TaxID=2811406 RepID=UPI003C3EA098